MFKANTEGLKTALRERTNVDLVSGLDFTTYSAMSSQTELLNFCELSFFHL